MHIYDDFIWHAINGRKKYQMTEVIMLQYYKAEYLCSRWGLFLESREGFEWNLMER